jgi:hypothetical protein
MKVKELIEELSELNPNLEIEIEIGDNLFRGMNMHVEEVFYDSPDNKYALIALE